MPNKRKAALIINTRSRRGERFFFTALDLLEKAGISIPAASAYPVRRPSRLREAVEQAIQDGNKLIIVGGGDGTIGALVDFFADKDLVFGLLPLGTANSFARNLHIPADIAAAVQVVASGKVARVDLGKINDEYFANNVSIGFTAMVANDITPPLKRYLGVFAYIFVSLRIFFTGRFFQCTFVEKGKERKAKSRQVIVANGTFYGPTALSEEAHVQSHKLMVFTLENLSRRQLLKAWAASFFKGELSLPSDTSFLTDEVEIRTSPKQLVDADGEIVTSTPAHFSIAPGALKVMVPQDFPKP